MIIENSIRMIHTGETIGARERKPEPGTGSLMITLCRTVTYRAVQSITRKDQAMLFPGAGASIYRNDAGEVLGWDYPPEPEYDPDDYLPDYDEGDEGDYDPDDFDSGPFYSAEGSEHDERACAELHGDCACDETKATEVKS